MRKTLGSLVLFLFGWKATFPTEYQIHKMLIVAAPHTSTWDIVFTFAVYWKKDLKPKFFIYDRYTKGLFGYFFRKMGAIGVSKNENKNLVDYSVKLFENSRELLLLITPEGTKYKTEKWRTGFFNIARLANVPLSLGWLDYKKKKAGIGGLLSITGDFEKDMSYIQKFYEDTNPKYPERYSKTIF